ncbi:hypothetical protein [Rhodococcus phenolicus]|uniref:hypothetical protein n=1 Tax=Rhodococcus phenolicus TaxID=263849 RepID=UPI000829E59F|nr:hypothetical protein [Rhodococcus phenolicus]
MSELVVDPAVLNQAAQGITGIIDALDGLGIGETATVGRGFSLLTLSPMEAGAPAVQRSFEGFTERWSWGVRALVQSANAIAETLGLAAGRYHEMEQQFSGMFKQMFTDLAGNPHLSAEEIECRSWSDTLADNAWNHVLNADYSIESFDNALAHVGGNASMLGQLAAENAQTSASPFAWNTGVAERAAELRAGGSGGE